jgi:hypothetical protein
MENPSQDTLKKQKEKIDKELFQKNTISHLQIVELCIKHTCKESTILNFHLLMKSSNTR